jgi:enoyl-[acyl-carrier protein] reductase II
MLDIIGIGKTKTGIFEGDIENGELEIGQAASLLKGRDIEPVEIVMERFVYEYYSARKQLINQAMEEQISRRTLM